MSDDEVVAPTTTTEAHLTQIALEQWSVDTPQGQITQIALEQWSSVELLRPTYFSVSFV